MYICIADEAGCIDDISIVDQAQMFVGGCGGGGVAAAIPEE